MEVESDFQYKMYFCEECQKVVSNLRWKSISKSLNGPEYRCDDCWDKLDKDLEEMIKNKMNS